MNTFLYCLGEDAEDVLDATRISVEDRKNYARVTEEFDNYFKVRKNIIFECTRFNRRNQLANEFMEQFINEAYRLADRRK